MGVIFDFNGTMFWDSDFHDQAWKKMSNEIRGKALSDDELAHKVHGKVNEKIIAYLCDVSATENKRISKEKEASYRRICRENPKQFTLAPGLEKYLSYLLEHKVSMNIATASIEDNVKFFVKEFQLEKWFDPNKIVYDDGHYQNKVKMFQDAALRIDETIDQCIIFEDSMIGVECAKQAKAKMIVVIAPKEKHSEWLKIDGVSHVIEDFNDKIVYEIIEKEKRV